jgi:hypothetical protein
VDGTKTGPLRDAGPLSDVALRRGRESPLAPQLFAGGESERHQAARSGSCPKCIWGSRSGRGSSVTTFSGSASVASPAHIAFVQISRPQRQSRTCVQCGHFSIPRECSPGEDVSCGCNFGLGARQRERKNAERKGGQGIHARARVLQPRASPKAADSIHVAVLDLTGRRLLSWVAASRSERGCSG